MDFKSFIKIVASSYYFHKHFKVPLYAQECSYICLYVHV